MGFIKRVGTSIHNFFGVWKWNSRYIKVINDGIWDDISDFLNEVISIDGAFTNKRYIWNKIRGKTFYKDIVHYVSRLASDIMELDSSESPSTCEILMQKIDFVVHEVLLSERSEKARKSFVWGLTKKVPLLTVDTIPYMSEDRIRNILIGEKRVLNDSALEPFIQIIVDLRKQVSELSNVTDVLSGMIGDE